MVACLLVLGFWATEASAQRASSGGVTQQQVNERNNLIANQEALLNVYRCLFDVDTQIVPGGCVDRKPGLDPPGPDLFSGTPTQQELDTRDELIASQEALLNVYRCLFDVDTQIVPGGCVDGKPRKEPDDKPAPEEPDDETAPEEPDDNMTPEALSPRDQLVYGEDPARLIAFADIVRAYSLGTDSWVVWSCDTPQGEWEIPPAELAKRLEAWAQPYFTWLSDGAYVPEFIAGESIEATGEQDCLDKVRNAASPPGMDGAVIVIDIPLVDCNNAVGCRRGWGEPGRCYASRGPEWIPDACPAHWPDNKREVMLGAVAVTSVPGQIPPTPNGFVFVHEMGHTLMWPHSYDRPDRYFGTNLMDFMGNGQTLSFGTPAINRYAAGWIAMEESAIHPTRVGISSSQPKPNMSCTRSAPQGHRCWC